MLFICTPRRYCLVFLLSFCRVPTQKAPLNAFVTDVTPHKDLLW